MKCCLVVGHKNTSRGAGNKASGATEYIFNNKLASEIKLRNRSNVEIQIVHRKRYCDLPKKINRLHPDFIISLHCNAFNGSASGTEVLYWGKTDVSDKLAAILQRNLTNALGLVSRGIKQKGDRSRGARVLRDTYAPCVIAEPFFIDNDNDLLIAQNNYDKLVNAFLMTIIGYAASTQKSYTVKDTYIRDDNIALIKKENNLLKSFILSEYSGMFYALDTNVKGVRPVISIESIKRAKWLLHG